MTGKSEPDYITVIIRASDAFIKCEYLREISSVQGKSKKKKKKKREREKEQRSTIYRESAMG